ncbi:MAG: hypothetical protein LBO76_07775, partial [Treponema sp.]|nr:hypothetical protein [Treponema sp.]
KKIPGVLRPFDPQRHSPVTGEPKQGSGLLNSIFSRRKKECFNFEGESGSRVYFCLRYENAKGREEGQGPFGPVLSAVIP